MMRTIVPTVSAPASSSIIKMSRCNGESFKRRGGIFLAMSVTAIYRQLTGTLPEKIIVGARRSTNPVG